MTTTTGVLGRRWRAAITPWGDVSPWSHDVTLRWHVAADDRWHDPATETTVRQRRIGGTPVTETRVRVPDGDVVQTVRSVADRGGATVVEVSNESPLPVAVAFSGLPVVTERAVSDVAVRGVALPDDAFVMPVGHRAAVRVAIEHEPGRWSGRELAGLRTDVGAVVSGWEQVAARASRLELPDEALGESVVGARSELLLSGPVDPSDDPAGFVLDVGELVRLGEDAEGWLPELVSPVEVVARSASVDAAEVVAAATLVATRAGDDRAVADLRRIARQLGTGAGSSAGSDSSAASASSASQASSASSAASASSASQVSSDSSAASASSASQASSAASQVSSASSAASASSASQASSAEAPSAGRLVRAIERRLAAAGELLPSGIPTAWIGADFEAHGLPNGVGSSVSFAVRWHGPRPAVLWEQHGVRQTLRAPRVDPQWSTDEVRGEALWQEPPGVAAR